MPAALPGDRVVVPPGDRVVVLDGGLSTALEQRGYDLSDPLWTARVLRDAPGAVADAHRAYFAAGAEVATTASYQASVPTLVASGLTTGQARSVLTRSVTIARDVRDELAEDGRRRWVAASVGPYGAVLADGSEYTGRYGISAARLRDFHLPRIELLLSAEPDLIAVETIPDVDEAQVLAEILSDVAVPAWFSFSTRAERTAADQPLAEAFSVAASPTNVVAVGVNCCPPPEVRDAVRIAVAVTGKPAVAYPNGATWDVTTRRWLATARYDATLAPGWAAAGAVLVGGCCGVGPADIAELAGMLAA